MHTNPNGSKCAKNYGMIFAPHLLSSVKNEKSGINFKIWVLWSWGNNLGEFFSRNKIVSWHWSPGDKHEHEVKKEPISKFAWKKIQNFLGHKLKIVCLVKNALFLRTAALAHVMAKMKLVNNCRKCANFELFFQPPCKASLRVRRVQASQTAQG